jgi:hypothetical protein
MFEGRVGEIIGQRARKKLLPAFIALCEAAKARAEAALKADESDGEAKAALARAQVRIDVANGLVAGAATH